MKTAVEVLKQELDIEMKLGTKMVVDWDMYKEMEKEQIMDAWKDGVIRDSGTLYADEYYNETFKSE